MTTAILDNYIYEYDKNTLEYLGKKQAEADPEETRTTGKFVPLVPAYATLIEPPKYKENQIPVFNSQENIWEILPDYRNNFYEVNNNLEVLDINYIGEISKNNYLVSKELGEKIKANKSMFKISRGLIEEKSEEEIKKDEIKAKERQFDELFFPTSLGYVKRIVTFKNGIKAAFLTDILSRLRVGVPIITYNKPDFSKDELPTQNTDVKVTEEFIAECDKQLLSDFYGEVQ